MRRQGSKVRKTAKQDVPVASGSDSDVAVVKQTRKSHTPTTSRDTKSKLHEKLQERIEKQQDSPLGENAGAVVCCGAVPFTCYTALPPGVVVKNGVCVRERDGYVYIPDLYPHKKKKWVRYAMTKEASEYIGVLAVHMGCTVLELVGPDVSLMPLRGRFVRIDTISVSTQVRLTPNWPNISPSGPS